MIYANLKFEDHPLIAGTETFLTWLAHLEVVDSQNWTIAGVLVPTGRAGEFRPISGTPLETAIRTAMGGRAEQDMLQDAVDRQLEEVRSWTVPKDDYRPTVVDLGRAA